MKETIHADLRASEFISLMTDESTDIGVEAVGAGRKIYSNSGRKNIFLVYQRYCEW